MPQTTDRPRQECKAPPEADAAPAVDASPATSGPPVSAIITAYNSADYIHRAIDSALVQTYPPHEVIVVDDGSHDGTADVITARYGDSVRVIRQENRGPNAARNRGAQESTGEWIAYLDGDDTWTPDRLAVQIPFTRQSDIGLVGAYGVQATPRELESGFITFEMMWKRNYIGVPTSLIRRTAFDELGGFDDDPRLVGAEDYNMWVRFAHSRWQVYLVAAEVFHYTSAPGSLYSQKERCLHGELLNVDKLEQRLGLTREQAQWRRRFTWHEYGLDFMQLRRLGEARRCFREALRIRFSWPTFVQWAATFVPAPLLNLRRRLRSSLTGSATPAAPESPEACAPATAEAECHAPS